MTLNIDNARLRELIPNVIHEVEGETSLADKLRPWLQSAAEWLEINVLGQFQPDGQIRALAEKIVAYRSFADAVPSLDLTLSPAGFAVIDTEGRAPASKERIQRLIASLRSAADANTTTLIALLHHQPQWANSTIGQWFRATFIPHLDDLPLPAESETACDPDAMLSAYRRFRTIATRLERDIEEKFLGRDFLESIRSEYPDFTTDGSQEIWDMLHTAELRFIDSCPKGRHVALDDNKVWHLVRPIIAQLDYWPTLKNAWAGEMGDRFNVKPFSNTAKGGYFF